MGKNCCVDRALVVLDFHGPIVTKGAWLYEGCVRHRDVRRSNRWKEMEVEHGIIFRAFPFANDKVK